MAEVRDSFLYAMMASFACGEGPLLLDAPADCCPGRITHGPAGCTCWQPIYDMEQQQPRLVESHAECAVRDGMCGDCAYRPNSLEKRGDPGVSEDGATLERLATAGTPFWCHDGMRQPVAWLHPVGIRIPVAAGREGDYQPVIRDGVPYRASGEPGLLCAGWSARHRARAALRERP